MSKESVEKIFILKQVFTIDYEQGSFKVVSDLLREFFDRY